MKFWRLITILLLPLFFSCKDDLTLELDNRTVAEGYYDSPQKLQQAVIGGYVDLRRALLANHAWLMYGEARVGDLQVAVDYQKAVVDQKLTTDNRYVKQLTDWGYFYDVIRDANDVLANIDAGNIPLSTYQKNLFTGEALALKSTAYFYLARVWSTVPSAEKNNFGKQLTNQEVVTLAAGFATQAKTLLPWRLINDDGIESTALTAIRFSKTAITSLLAQEQLWLGNSQNAYEVLNSTFNANTLDSLADFNISLGSDRRTPIPEIPLAPTTVSMTLDKLNSIYPTGDARRSSLFNISTTQNKATLIIKAADMLEFLPVREINLLLAEAAWRTGRLAEAKTALTKAAVGATENYNNLTDATFADALLTERRRILVGTGQRVFDLTRFGRLSTAIPLFTDTDLAKGAAFWPLSATSMKSNSLSQNSYWLSKN